MAIETKGYTEIPIEQVTAAAEIERERWEPNQEELVQITREAVGSVPVAEPETFRTVPQEHPLRKEGVIGFVRVEGVNEPVALLDRGDPRIVQFEVAKGHSTSFPGLSLGLPKEVMRSVLAKEIDENELGSRTLQGLWEGFEELKSKNKQWSEGFHRSLLSHPEVKDLLKTGQAARVQRKLESRNQPIREVA